MPPEVIRAMEEGSRFFIPLPELEKKVGARIAELLKAPAAMVTCGAGFGHHRRHGRVSVARRSRQAAATCRIAMASAMK